MNTSRWTFQLALLTCILCMGCGQTAPKTSLPQAVQEANTYLVRKHIAAKTDLNKPDASGMTPLQIAAASGNLAIVQVLVDAGADVNRKNAFGKTALDLAREHRQTAVVAYFQERAAGPVAAKKGEGGRGLVDGGLGVSAAMDAQ